jgi:hypothetical protein
MDLKKILLILSIAILTGLFVTWYAYRAKSREKAMITEIEIQLDAYNKQRIKECRTKAIERAGFLVDSLLLANAKSIQTDTNSFLLKPVKPTKPTILTADSSGVVAPLFGK